MLSYRHLFHAGNFADAHKHAILCALIAGLHKKEAALCYLDTHAGAGRYDLKSPEAQKNAEYRLGIERLWHQNAPSCLAPYLDAVRSINAHAEQRAPFPRYYPGSPRLIRALLRPQDRMILTELHPTDAYVLKQEFAGDRQAAVHHLDAAQGLKAFLPPQERRGLVLMDPAYELRDEGKRTLTNLINAWQRWPQGVFALWYPLTHRALADYIQERVSKAHVKKSLVSEINVFPPINARQLTGSGMLIINPPWGTFEVLTAVNNFLAKAFTAAGQRVAWLLPE